MKKILFDTDILLDYLQQRDPFFEDVAALFTLVAHKNIQGYISVLSFPNIFYILRKEQVDVRGVMLVLTKYFQILSLEESQLLASLHNDKFRDFEDCLLYETARSNGIDIIFTRNIKDYKYAQNMKVISPVEFLLEYV